MNYEFLSQDIMYLPGVGPNRKKLLSQELGIETFGDLLEYYPYKYVDRTRVYAVSELTGDMPFVQVVGQILSFETFKMTPTKDRVVAHFSDGTAVMDLVWFGAGGKYAKQNYRIGTDYLVFGRPTVFNNRIQVTHPDIDEVTKRPTPHEPQRPTSHNPTPTPSPREGSLDTSTLENPQQSNQAPLPWGGDGGGFVGAGALGAGALGYQPYYNTTEKMKNAGLTTRGMERLTKTLIAKLPPQPETLPPFIVGNGLDDNRNNTPEEGKPSSPAVACLNLMSRDEALRTVHYPKDAKSLEKARVRLKFEELFFVQLNILRYASDQRRKYRGLVFSRVGEVFNAFYHAHLPFPLTEAQKRVMREIRRDMGSGRQMNRLLQGDVGSGKTLVALMSMLIALDNGYQACIMAPTEILAEQHLQTIRQFLGQGNPKSTSPMPIRVELLTGIVKGRRRQEVLDGLLDGSVHILVGTHAVIEDTVQFQRLGMVVVDEQHRFGVKQRAKLWSKATLNPQPSPAPSHLSPLTSHLSLPTLPHVLVMTATPIPRTLAMTLYGDLDVSVIDELPPGRKPIVTRHYFDSRIATLYDGIRRQLQLGRQVYWVFPLIEESEKSDMKNLEQGFEVLQQVFPEFRLSKVHGRMKPADKEAEMQRFVSGETQILVATTVIEVGVNVPNASVMVIMDAHRFGLSQLHQLRGRVGRGAEQSYCLLVTPYKLSEDTRKRIDIMCDTNDGFRIAEADLKLRGPGDLEGTQQSGMGLDLKIADIARDGQLVQMARDAAQAIVDDDPTCSSPKYQLLWKRLQELRKTAINWGAIS